MLTKAVRRKGNGRGRGRGRAVHTNCAPPTNLHRSTDGTPRRMRYNNMYTYAHNDGQKQKQKQTQRQRQRQKHKQKQTEKQKPKQMAGKEQKGQRK